MKYIKNIYKMVCYIMIIMCLTACTKPDEDKNEFKDDAKQIHTSGSEVSERLDMVQENDTAFSADEVEKDDKTDSAANTVLHSTTEPGDQDSTLPEVEVKKNLISDNTDNHSDVDQESLSGKEDDDIKTEENRDHGEDDKPKPEEDNGEHKNEDEGDAQEDVMPTPTPTPGDNGVIRDENGDILLPEAP